MLRSLVGSEMCIRDSARVYYSIIDRRQNCRVYNQRTKWLHQVECQRCSTVSRLVVEPQIRIEAHTGADYGKVFCQQKLSGSRVRLLKSLSREFFSARGLSLRRKTMRRATFVQRSRLASLFGHRCASCNQPFVFNCQRSGTCLAVGWQSEFGRKGKF